MINKCDARSWFDFSQNRIRVSDGVQRNEDGYEGGTFVALGTQMYQNNAVERLSTVLPELECRTAKHSYCMGCFTRSLWGSSVSVYGESWKGG